MSSINTHSFGVSFSRKYCRTLNIDPNKTLEALLNLGFRRFRLMSYWDEIEKTQGVFDFSWLDEDIKKISSVGGEVSLCVGLRQPRWPECHPPQWYGELNHKEKHQAIYSFVERVITHYKDDKTITSWQLENEAFNRGIGVCDDYCRQRIIKEFQIIKSIDISRPVIMSLSNNYGLPLRKPRADMYAFSLYRSQHTGEKYSFSRLPVPYYKNRARLIKVITGKQVFIHELQCEPWGPKSTELLTDAEQMKSMSLGILKENLIFAQKTNLYPIDLWGGEWWCWRAQELNDSRYLDAVKNYLC